MPFILSALIVLSTSLPGYFVEDDPHSRSVTNAHFTGCATGTGNNATVAIPATALLTFAGEPLAFGDEIAAFTENGLCAGTVVYEKAAAALTLWGDNDQTPEIDGFVAGESVSFRLWQEATDRESTSVSATFAQGSQVYTPNGIYVLAALEGSVNQAPQAEDLLVTLEEDASLAITLQGSDPDGDALSFTILSEPEHGSTAQSGEVVTYTPDADYSGSDSFTYSASDGAEDSGAATVSVSVSPVADAPVFTSSAPSSATQELLYNYRPAASDADGDAVTISAPTLPDWLTFSGGLISGTPGNDDVGDHAVVLRAEDTTGLSSEEAFTLRVSNTNDPPQAEDLLVTLEEDASLAITLQGSDPDGDALSFTILSEPEHGSTAQSGEVVTYTPDADYSGSDSFTYSASDGAEDSGAATVSVSVSPVNDTPTARDLEAETPEDTPVTVTLMGDDVDNDELAYVVATAPEHGAVTIEGAAATYIPEADFNGSDAFVYSVADPAGASSRGTVAITVTSQNETNAHFTGCATGTGNNATVAIPATALLTFAGEPLAFGDEIAAFTENGLCAGTVVYEEAAAALTLWGDNDQTPEIDGFVAGESVSFRLWQEATDRESTSVSATFAQGSQVYTPNGIYVLASLGAEASGTSSHSALRGGFEIGVPYPNPTRRVIRFRSRLPQGKVISISVYDMLGRCVLEQQATPLRAGTRLIEINVSLLPAGTYVVRFAEKADGYGIRTFVKQ